MYPNGRFIHYYNYKDVQATPKKVEKLFITILYRFGFYYFCFTLFMNFPGYPPAISHIRKFKILIKNGHVGHAHGKINGKIIDCKPGRCFIRSRL